MLTEVVGKQFIALLTPHLGPLRLPGWLQKSEKPLLDRWLIENAMKVGANHLSIAAHHAIRITL